MPDTIKAAEKPLIKVFCDDYLFSIPSYQRPYAWTPDEAGQLLDDLLGSLEDGTPGELSPYFLGSIVLIKDPQRADADVVDGQQRLTTLTVLFCVLRDLEPDDRAQKVHKYVCQVGDEFAGTKDQFRLAPRDRDAGFFRRCIQEFGATKSLVKGQKLPDSQANIIANSAYFRERLEAIDSKIRATLITFMVQRCFLVVVEASDRASAYRIFSVMNDRGLDLSPTDILKADIIGALDDEDVREAYTKKWEDLEEDLGREAFRDLFRHIYLLYRHDKIRGTLEDQIRLHVKPQTRPAAFIDEELRPLAEAYLLVKKQAFASTHLAAEINAHLQYLSWLDNADWEAPAALYMSRMRAEPEALLRFLKDLDRLAYGLFVQRSNINERILRYGRIVKEIQDGADLYRRESPLQLTGMEQGRILNALDGPIYEMIQRVRVPLLLRLDEAVSDGSARYEHKIITVEHVLPQNPVAGGKWTVWFPDEQQRQAWVHRLANLALLSRVKNAQASNFEFQRKKDEYFSRKGTSPFALTSQVLKENTWTPEVLERRQKNLVGTLATLWRLEPDEADRFIAQLLA
jgi:hypothetical protein